MFNSLLKRNIHLITVCTIFSIFFTQEISAQTDVKIGTNPGIKRASAVLELESTTKGFLLPRMTTAQMDAIASPSLGLMVFNTDLNCIHFYFSGWKSQCDAANIGAWSLLGNVGTNANTNFLGTTDNVGLRMRTNNQNRMHIGANGHIAIGNYNNQPIDNIGLLWGAGTFPIAFNLQDSISDFSTSLYQGMVSLIKIKPAANWAGSAYAANFDIHTPTDFSGNLTGATIGYAGDVRHYGTGTVNALIASNNATANHSTGTVTNAYGWNGNIFNYGTGTISNAYGVKSWISKAAGNITNGYAFYADSVQATNAYGFYQVDQANKNYFAGHTAFGNYSNNANDGSLNWGVAPFRNNINIQEKVTDAPDASVVTGINNALLLNPTQATTTVGVRGAFNSVHTEAGNATSYTSFGLVATESSARHRANGNVNQIAANYNVATNEGTGTVNTLRGAYVGVRHIGAGTTTNLYGIQLDNIQSGGAVTNSYGIFYQGTGGSGTTNGYGIYLGDVQAANSWGLYQANVNNKNYFAGNVGIGNYLPSYKLDIDANTGGTGNPLRLLGLQAGAAGDSVLTSNAGVVRRMSAAELTSANAWSLLGNGGTNVNTNFLGTTDNASLTFRTNNTRRMTLDSLGRVALGNFNNNADDWSVYPSIGSLKIRNRLSIQDTLQDLSKDITFGLNVSQRLDANANNNNSVRSIQGNVYTTLGNTFNNGLNIAVDGNAYHYASGTVGTQASGWFAARNLNNGIITSNYGVSAIGTNSNSGSITNNYGLFAQTANYSTGLINNNYGLYVDNTGSNANINNNYGLYLGNLSGTKRWGIYQEGLNDYNYFKGRTSIGGFSEKPDTSAIYPGFKTGNLLAVQGEFTNAEYTAGGAYQGIMVGFQPNPTSAVNGGTAFRGINSQISIPVGNTQNIPQLLGISSDVGMKGTGTVSTAMGFNTGVYTATPGSSITDAFGVYSNVSATASTTINSAYALRATVRNTAGTINAGYGLYIEDIQATNAFGIYQESTNDKNYFAGNIGINTTAPQYKLDINAQTGSSGNPLRLLGLQAGAAGDSVLTSNAGVVRRMSAAELTSANAWSLLGNGGTNASTNFLGTTDNVGLRFRTNNTERMFINPTGNVAIGNAVSNPDSSHIRLGNDWSNTLNVSRKITDYTKLVQNGVYSGVLLENSAVASNGFYDGFHTDLWTSPTSTQNFNWVNGINIYPKHQGSGTINTGMGLWTQFENAGTGNVTNAYGLRSQVFNTGTGTITNGYGLFLEDNTGTITNKYGVYQTGSSNKNHFAGRTHIGNAGSTPDTAIIYPTLPHFNVLSVQQDDYTPAEWASSKQWYQGIGWNLRVSPTAPNKYIYGDNGAVEVKATNTQPIGILAGTVSGAINNGTGTVNSTYNEFDVYHTSTGLINDGAALRSRIANAGTGTISAAYGMDANINNNATGTITTAIAVNAAITNPLGTITTAYGVNINDLQATNAFGVYQRGANDRNYFAGNVGVGTAAPTSTLEVAGSIAVAFAHVTTNTTLNATNHIVLADATLSPITLTLPTASTCPGRTYVIGKEDETSNVVNISPALYLTKTTTITTIDFAKKYKVVSDGTNWWIYSE